MKTSAKLMLIPLAAGIIATAQETNGQDIESYFKPKLTLKDNTTSIKSNAWDNMAGNVIFQNGEILSHVQLDVGGIRQISVPSPANGFMNLGFEGNWAIISKLGKSTRLITSIGADVTLKYATQNDVKRVLANGNFVGGGMFTFSNDKYRLWAGVSFPFSTKNDTASAVLPQNVTGFVGTKLGPVFLALDGAFSDKGLQRFGGLIEVVPVYFLSFTGTVKTGVKDAYRLALVDVGAKIKATKSNKYFIDVHAYGGLGREKFYQSGRFADKYLYGGSVGFESTGNYRISLGIDGAYEPLNTDVNKNGVPSIGGFMKFQLYFPSLGQKKYKKYSSLYLEEKNIPSAKDMYDKTAMLKDIAAKVKAVEQGKIVQSKKSGLYVPARLA